MAKVQRGKSRDYGGARPIGIDAQPISTVQWVDRETLFANDYNPNHVAPPEFKLIKVSIMEDGWTAPIVALPSGEIVDGFHRWSVSKDPDVWSLTDGMVPVVRVEPDRSGQIMTTIRQNRARGQHKVMSMAENVRELLEQGKSREEIQHRLGMEPEEVERLADASGMPNRAGEDQLGRGWVPE